MKQEADARVDWPPPQEQKRTRGRPRKDDRQQLDTDGLPVAKKPRAGVNADLDQGYLEAVNVRGASLIGGVNVTWLSQAFRIDTRTVRKRVAGLKPAGIGSRGDEIYDFVEAASYLAPPQRDKFARWISTLRTSDLPTQLQDSYWAAMRKRQIWEQNAGELWKTDDVAEVMGEVFKTIKSNIQLWTDNMDANGDLPEEQRAKIQQMADGLQQEIYQSLVAMPLRRRTPSSLYDPEVITNSPQFEVDDDEDMIG